MSWDVISSPRSRSSDSIATLKIRSYMAVLPPISTSGDQRSSLRTLVEPTNATIGDSLMTTFGLTALYRSEQPNAVSVVINRMTVVTSTMIRKNMTKQRILVCPICGETQRETSVCRSCDTPLDANGLLYAELAVGPWWIRDVKRPFCPRMTYDHIVSMEC